MIRMPRGGAPRETPPPPPGDPAQRWVCDGYDWTGLLHHALEIDFKRVYGIEPHFTLRPAATGLLLEMEWLVNVDEHVRDVGLSHLYDYDTIRDMHDDLDWLGLVDWMVEIAILATDRRLGGTAYRKDIEA